MDAAEVSASFTLDFSFPDIASIPPGISTWTVHVYLLSWEGPYSFSILYILSMYKGKEWQGNGRVPEKSPRVDERNDFAKLVYITIINQVSIVD